MYYEEIVSLKGRLEAVSRDFVAEIPVDDTITPLPSAPRGPTRVVPVQVKTGTEAKTSPSPKVKPKEDKSDKKSKGSDHLEVDSEKPKKEKKDKKDDKKEKEEKKEKKDKASSPSNREFRTPPDSSRSS